MDRLEEGALGGHPADGLHEVGELQHLGQLEAPLGLRRRPLLLRLAPRLGDVVLRLLHSLGALLVQLPLSKGIKEYIQSKTRPARISLLLVKPVALSKLKTVKLSRRNRLTRDAAVYRVLRNSA